MAGDPPSGPAPLFDADSCPRLAPGVKLVHDDVRGQWILNAPERVLLLDDIAHAIVSRIDGKRPLTEICDGLAAAYDAPREMIGADVLELVRDLARRGFLRG